MLEAGATITHRVLNLKSAAAAYLWSKRVADDALARGWDLDPGGKDEPKSRRLYVDPPESTPSRPDRAATAASAMPVLGDDFLGFRLIEELGRGAFGRVFLAQQGDLADRLVALKVSPEMPGESRTLAQLQHTNIVPIFSVHQALPLHAICMPYYGRTTLVDLLSDVEHQENLPDSGQALLKTLGSRRFGQPSGPGSGSGSGSKSKSGSGSRPAFGSAGRDPGSFAPPGPAEVGGPPVDGGAEPPVSETLRTIGSLSYVGAVLWMGARIADGLAHAHGRGILHRDLKPANILLTDDGQPMILDFNLSEDIKTNLDSTAASLGGTLPYMSPEHMERFLGQPTTLDARGDIYALGVILYELLTGRHPFEIYPGFSVMTIRRMIQDRKAAAPRGRAHNPGITPAVESILRRCLEPELSRRYQAAAELREDLERQLADLPLKHAPEPSLRERAGKWARRHPRLGSTTSILVVSAILLAGLGSSLAVRGRRLAEFEAARDFRRFLDGAASVRFLLNYRTDDLARRALGEARAAELLEPLGVLDDPAWAARPAVANLPGPDRGRLREEVAEVLMMLTQARALDADGRDEPQGRRDLARSARRLGQLAMLTLPDGRQPQAFWAQQAALARLLGDDGEGRRLAEQADKAAPKTARDFYLAAVGLALRGEHARALPLAEQASRLDPADFWSWYVQGICHDRLERPADAMACATTCIALRPDFADSWLNRGLAYLKRNDLERARADLDRAALLRPDWYEPFLNRAVVHRELGDHLAAENDLTRALERKAPETRAYFLRAAAREKRGDLAGAELDRREGLRRQPTDVPSWVARGLARMAKDPRGALDDFAAALKLDPRSLDALQMSAYVLSDLPGRDEDTVRMLDRAVELYPDHVPVRSGRGVQLAILGRRDEALRDARESLWRDTSPAILYQVAGIYATTSKAHPEDRLEAFRLLAGALRAGFGFELIDEDRELDPIRHDPEFQAVVASARAQARERLHRPPGR